MVSVNSRLTKNRKKSLNSNVTLQTKAYNFIYDILFNPSMSLYVAMALIPLELCINLFTVFKVNYTEIDWIAYMQEVEGFLNGTFNYYELKGDTGPLVYVLRTWRSVQASDGFPRKNYHWHYTRLYPAGFVYIYSAFYAITSKGVNIRLAQYLFIFIYLLFISMVFYIYTKSKKVPPLCLIIMCLASRRIHSIFVLRLFNDPIAMLFLYASIAFMISGWWRAACVCFSLGVSVKMNVLLFAPGLFIALVLSHGIYKTIGYITLCAVIQLILGLPFLLSHPVAYLHRAFEFSRQFFYIWTVNWKCVPEDVFLSRKFQLVLLLLHLIMLFVFMNKYLNQSNVGGLKGLFNKRNTRRRLTPDFIITIMFLSNFIGICFSRSLHYQFYVWYYHTFAYLLWSTPYHTLPKLLIYGILEFCWNVYPSVFYSSILLHACHLSVLFGVWLKLNVTTKTSTD